MDQSVAMDMELSELLNKWNLNHMYKKFNDEHITIEVLKILQPCHISKLFNDFPIGDQAIFEHNLKIWRKSVEETQGDDTEVVSISKQKIEVYEILSSTFNGKEIIKFYEKNNVLHEQQRTLLISTVTKFLEASGTSCTVSDCSDIEKQICTIFPTEKIEFYTNGKRGKIYNKLANLKRLSKDILKEDLSSKKSVELTDDNENYDLIIKSMRSENIHADEFDLYWRKCAPYRFIQIKETKHTSQIFELWPEFARASGTQLIDIDFKLKFGNAKSFKGKWADYEDKLLIIMKNKLLTSFVSRQLNEIDSKNEESKILVMLWSMHHLFPPTLRSKTDKEGAKFRKKHTVADSQEGFAIIADTREEVEAKLKVIKLQGRHIQPRLLIVGQFPCIETITVYFDEKRYPFLTILNAVDLLFKIFFVFDLEYPNETEIFYNFIQTCFYDIPSMKNFVKVSTIKHEILKLKN